MRFPDPLEHALARILADHEGDPPAALVPLLKAVQRELGYVGDEALRAIADRLGVSFEDAENIAGFFSFRRERPEVRYVVEVCVNVSCRRRGGDAILARCKERLGVEPGQATPDKVFRLQEIVCLGLCQSGPAVRVERDRYDAMTAQKVDDLVDRLRAAAEGWSSA